MDIHGDFLHVTSYDVYCVVVHRNDLPHACWLGLFQNAKHAGLSRANNWSECKRQLVSTLTMINNIIPYCTERSNDPVWKCRWHNVDRVYLYTSK